MITDIDARLLEQIADLTGQPAGAFNIRKDSGCDGRQSTENIEITNKDLEQTKSVITYRFTDIYGEYYWTPAL